MQIPRNFQSNNLALLATSVTSWLLTLAVFLYCVWILDLGFDITDESYYLLLAIQANSQELYVSAQHWLTSWLWQLSGSLISFRATGLLILLASSILLAGGAHSFLSKAGALPEQSRFPGLIYSTSILSALFYGSTINFSPCYNLMASAGAYSAAGLMLLASGSRSAQTKYILYVLVGGALGVATIAKASSGISTLIVMAGWLFCFEKDIRSKSFSAGSILVGLILFCWLALLSNTTPQEAKNAFLAGLELFRIVQSESIFHRLIRYGSHFGVNVARSLIEFGVPLTLLVGFGFTRKNILLVMSGIAVVLTILFREHWIGGWDNGRDVRPPLALFALFTFTLFASTSAWLKSNKLIHLVIGLAVLPYAVAMGTGNGLFTQAIVTLAPWGTVVGIACILPYTLENQRWAVLICGLPFMFVVALQMATSAFRPYHLNGQLNWYRSDFNLPDLGRVRTDERTHAFLSDLRLAAEQCKIEAGTPVLGLYNVPGVALVLRAVPPMSAWLNNAEQADFVIKRVGYENFKSLVVVINEEGQPTPPKLPEQLKGFPAGFTKCGSATYPFAEQKIHVWIKDSSGPGS